MIRCDRFVWPARTKRLLTRLNSRRQKTHESQITLYTLFFRAKMRNINEYSSSHQSFIGSTVRHSILFIERDFFYLFFFLFWRKLRMRMVQRSCERIHLTPNSFDYYIGDSEFDIPVCHFYENIRFYSVEPQWPSIADLYVEVERIHKQTST